ncbi:MAG TPA: aminotransferase class I/II-fold pyridoxal phosphate-dependent enzyme, partial [Pseudonocardiaceae bacterium]|nr:aminotransferase class I/II-fold pyridoxal phosphate-dependent enzyme [Pseudonocardiaceae bacterium]
RVVHSSRPLGLPVVRSAAFAFDSAHDYAEVLGGRAPGYSYSRIDNPTAAAFAAAVSALEAAGLAAQQAADVGAEPFASGMAAISTTLLGHLAEGDEVLAPVSCYGGTWSLFIRRLPRWGVRPVLLDVTDVAAVRAAITPRTRVIYVETIGNPTLSVPDLPVLADIAHRAGGLLVVDSTLAPPTLCRPLEHGADLVLHSATKFLGGHADATGGVVTGRPEHLDPVREARIDLGGCLAPDEAFLLHRGLATLDLRVQRQCATAAEVARKLAGHPAVERVSYPGLTSHPQHATARRLFRSGHFGSLITLEVSGGRAAGMAFCDALRLVRVATSLGSVHSKVSHAASTTHRQLDDAALEAAGIGPGQVRISVGVENPGELFTDLRQALETA